MKRNIAAIVAVAGIVVACAPGSQTPASPAAAGTSQIKPAQPAQGAATPSAGIMKTVAEIYAGQNDLLDTVVKVRGKVAKYSAQIMGKNWIHLQDGTGSAGTNDLTITTADSAKAGDTVLVTGKITLKKDFGMGYKYDLIIEDGTVAVEAK